MIEKKSERWIEDKILKGEDKTNAWGMRRGYFYTMTYDSKMYELKKLNFYDKQPVILCIGSDENYALGLNFHYLPKDVRLKVLKRLVNRYRKQYDDDKPFPNAKWEDVKRELKYSDFMIKLYIKDRIIKASRIKNKEIKKILDLDSHDFIGVDINKLWLDMGLI